MVAKIVKAKGQKATDVEKQVANALQELQNNNEDMKADLTDLYITAAKEVAVSGNKTAIVIFVPFVLHKKFQKLQDRVIRELEKKFSGKHVCIVAQRTIFSKQYIRSSNGAMRPRTRTLTAVHESILEDIVHPVNIVGKRTRVRLDQTKLLKVMLDPKDVKEVDFKLKTFAAVYKALTNKAVEFSF
jgi:small subunit ribosomal protein S7e